MSRKILSQLRETNAKVDEIEIESQHDKKDIAYLMAENLMIKGKLYRTEGFHEEALKMFEKAIKIESSDRAWGLKALQHFYLKQYDEALNANLKALELERSGDTQDYQLHWNHACFLSLLERGVEEIIFHIDQALKLRPELKDKIATEEEFAFARQNKVFCNKYNIEYEDNNGVV
jgi:tetratricopeptide (TPR) repeat protein